MTALPMYIVLKSSAVVRNVNGYIAVSGSEVLSPYSKTEIERSKTAVGLVHLRCCYNNKYWCSKPDSSGRDIMAAEQNEAEDDKSLKTCTLFSLELVNNDPERIRIKHVQSGKYLTEILITSVLAGHKVLWASSSSPSGGAVFNVIDWETLLILPKYVAFRGDNGEYLQGYYYQSRNYLQFGATDYGSKTALHEVFQDPSGTSVRIKSHHFGKFWRNAGDWIHANSDSGDDDYAKFIPIKVNSNVVALRNVGNNRFCKRLSYDKKDNCLNAAVSTITKEAKMDVQEVVLSRTIYNVQYRLGDARIYDETVLTMATAQATNLTSNPSTKTLSFAYKQREGTTWNSSVSFKAGVEMSFTAGVPFITKEGIKVSAEISYTKEWGGYEETETEVQTQDEVVVPPMTRVRARLLATSCKCDVPFSYTQRDILYDGTQVIQELSDGIFTGVNSFDFQSEILEETPIAASELEIYLEAEKSAGEAN